MLAKNELKKFLEKYGAFKVGVADPKRGFEMAREGCRPRDVMKNCNSVVVFALHVGLDYYTTLEYYQKGGVESRVLSIYRDWVSLQLTHLLKEKGYKTVIPHGFKNWENSIASLSFKLAAYEAGLGVFGRPSILITPECGPRANLGVVLTNASINPDQPLRKFNPCQKCDVCANVCPVSAIDKEQSPPKGFNRSRCLSFIHQIREKTQRKIMLCGYCYNSCPVGEKPKKTFSLGMWRTLLDLKGNERTKLVQTLTKKK